MDLSGAAHRVGRAVVGLLTIVSIAVFVAAPWLRQELVWCEWIGLAAALVLVPRVKGWLGEVGTLLAGALALGIAFHWSPEVLANCMQVEYETALCFVVPIVLLDAVRLALPFWCAGRIARDPRAAWLPAATAAVAVEAIFPGVFPWKLGYSQIGWPVLIQGVDLFGPEWSTFVLYAHAGLLVSLVMAADRRSRHDAGGTAGRAWTASCAAAAAVVALNLAYGTWAMAHYRAAAEAAPRIAVALVQCDPEREDSILALRRATRAVQAAAPRPLDLVCWPECSAGTYESCLSSFADPEAIHRHSRDPARGLRPLERPVCPLLFGGRIYTGFREKPRELFQSALLIDTDETLVGRYDKRHLMPFGEYVPGGEQFPELHAYFPMQEDYDVGREATVLPCGDARLGAMLCYEDMVPGAAMSLVGNGANLLVSLINGVAFTEPLTLLQHRLLATLRAVENRRAFLRCAATGETCVISPLGIVTARLPLHVEEVLTAEVPLLETRTIAGRIGPAFPVACAICLGWMWFVARRRSQWAPVAPPTDRPA